MALVPTSVTITVDSVDYTGEVYKVESNYFANIAVPTAVAGKSITVKGATATGGTGDISASGTGGSVPNKFTATVSDSTPTTPLTASVSVTVVYPDGVEGINYAGWFKFKKIRKAVSYTKTEGAVLSGIREVLSIQAPAFTTFTFDNKTGVLMLYTSAGNEANTGVYTVDLLVLEA
jgi:hypothetical protein